MKIVILSPSIVDHDAVTNDVVFQSRFLQSLGLNVSIYSSNDALQERGTLKFINKSQLSKIVAQPNNILIYHQSILWDEGKEVITSANCHKILKYHNITPPAFFADYNQNFFNVTKSGREQTDYYIKNDSFDILTADSFFNASEINENQQVTVIPPYTKLDDFDFTQMNLDLLKKQIDFDGVKVLFVGRFAPNKGVHHLIKVIESYRFVYDQNIKLTIVGSIDPQLKSYFEFVRNLIEESGVSNNIEIKDKVNFEDLVTHYNSSDVFLLCSEHEGFCVPVLEAQKVNLPIIAFNSSAVPETMGPNQLILHEMNYTKFAVAINQIKNNLNKKILLTEQGRENLKRFDREVINKKLEETINHFTK